jgi:hypothetical protein
VPVIRSRPLPFTALQAIIHHPLCYLTPCTLRMTASLHEKKLKWAVIIKWIDWLGLDSRKITDRQEHFLKVDRLYLDGFHL